MSLRKVFRSRKFSRSFKEIRAIEEDEAHSRVGGGDSGEDSGQATAYDNGWSSLLPELLGEIIQLVDASEDQWPNRQNVVACACVCKRWRELTREIVRSPSQSGKITFPSSLKEVCN